MKEAMFDMFKGTAGAGPVPVIAPADAAKLMRSEDVLLVDVRELSEVAQSGRIKGARVVPLGALSAVADPASAEFDPAFRKDRPVILYCATGNRSNIGAQALLRLGYATVYNLGGFRGWADAGLPVERA